MTTKLQRASRIVDCLANQFEVVAPTVRVFSGGGANGYYEKAEGDRVFFTNLARTRTRIIPAHEARILLRERTKLETLAHEFGHHLEELRGLGIHEPPVTLPEVRQALGNRPHDRLEHPY